jgi:hypothetical protein
MNRVLCVGRSDELRVTALHSVDPGLIPRGNAIPHGGLDLCEAAGG